MITHWDELEPVLRERGHIVGDMDELDTNAGGGESGGASGVREASAGSSTWTTPTAKADVKETPKAA